MACPNIRESGPLRLLLLLPAQHSRRHGGMSGPGTLLALTAIPISESRHRGQLAAVNG